jgi:NADPH:quinone reductase
VGTRRARSLAARALTMRALQFAEFGLSNLRLAELPDPKPGSATAIVKVGAASLIASDLKNVEGKMEHTTLPRVPGRDYAGTVVQGPAEWVGAPVWGTGGEIGYSIDGSHAELIAVPVASLRRRPEALSMEQAAVIGTTYLAAWLGLVEYGHLAAGETLLVIGASGGVGVAAAQIGEMARCSRHWRRSTRAAVGFTRRAGARRFFRPGRRGARFRHRAHHRRSRPAGHF